MHYAYCPCPDAVLSVHELVGRGFDPQPRQRILAQDIVGGQDELGVLLAGHPRGAFWFGSQLSIEEARAIVPHANATALQVAAGILGGMAAAVARPALGLVEPEALDFRLVLATARPYLGRADRRLVATGRRSPAAAGCFPRRSTTATPGGSPMSAWPEPPPVAEPRRRLAMLVGCPYLFVGDAGARGLGVFTARPIAAGAVIVADEDGSLRRRALPLATALAQGWDRRARAVPARS